MAIHPTAVIDRQAEIDPTAEIGPYVIIEGPVKIAAHTQVRAHAYLSGWTEIGERCDIHPLAVVGHMPQDFHYGGERSYCKIGNGVVIRESATVHRGTQPESTTWVGDECFLLAHSHVGHNCRLGRGVKVYNMAALSGHVEADDFAIISGYGAVHQFTRIGRYAFVAGGARALMDVPPFMTCYGVSTIVQYNAIGMRRAGFDTAAINEIRRAFRLLYGSGIPFSRAATQLAETVETDAGRMLVEFLQAESKRGYCAGSRSHRSAPEWSEAGAQDIPGEADTEATPEQA
ncbi:MAG: acyl-ACP--UDP-N-acetylglucosamine O-acyltransferase [Phycisphaerae bacterium]|nr:acyl-ACP--UDP-N-acetylglucosamine O-acyltransferase [Phycisphaerae bacterium]